MLRYSTGCATMWWPTDETPPSVWTIVDSRTSGKVKTLAILKVKRNSHWDTLLQVTIQCRLLHWVLAIPALISAVVM